MQTAVPKENQKKESVRTKERTREAEREKKKSYPYVSVMNIPYLILCVQRHAVKEGLFGCPLQKDFISCGCCRSLILAREWRFRVHCYQENMQGPKVCYCCCYQLILLLLVVLLLYLLSLLLS